MKKAAQLILVLLLTLGSLSSVWAEADRREIRIGVFQVDPLNFTNENGVADGFNVDLLHEISKTHRRWKPTFVPVTWADGLKQLQTEQLDLMMSVSYTPERAEVMDYNKESILEVWGQVYVRPGSGIESTLDLEGLSVGVMKADIHGKNFITLADAFGINYSIVEFSAHADVFKAVREGEVDAGVVPSHYGPRHARQYALIGTSIQFSPAPIFFASKKGRHSDVLVDIDAVMADWKEDPDSFYYSRFNYWFGDAQPWAQVAPLWLKIIIGVSIATAMLFLVLSGLFKRKVKLRTKELSESEERHRSMVAALTASEREYRQLFENMTTGFLMFEVINGASGSLQGFKVVQVNQAVCEMTGMDRKKILGHELKAVFAPLEDYWLNILSQVATTGQAASYENRMEAVGLILSAWIFVPRDGYIGVVITDNTARRVAEDAVLAAQQQLQHIVDNTKDGIWQIDLEGNFVYANTAAESLTGYTMDQVLNMNIMDLIMPEFHDMAKSRIARRVAGDPDDSDYSFMIRCADGSLKWLELSTSNIFDAEGKLEGIQGIARDVTQRKLVEQELEESRHFLRTIIDTVPVRLFWKDTESKFLGCNRAFARDLGVEKSDDLTGKTDYDLSVSMEEAEHFRADDRIIMEEMVERIAYEEPRTRLDGKVHWLSTSKVPLCDTSGKLIGILGAYQDITERKMLEEERKRLFAAINQSAEAIVIMDLEGVIQYINQAFVVVTGYESAEAIGAKLEIIKSGKHDEQFYEGIWRTIRSGQSWNGRIINRHKNGSYYTVDAAFSPVRETAEQIVSCVVAIRDVSKQVELEKHVLQAQKMDAVGRLAGGVAHDFNNILQSIFGFCGILLSELDENSSQYDDVFEIRKAARRAGDLTRQLLTLSRKQNNEFTVLNLNTIIEQNEKMMRRLIGGQVEFVFDLNPLLKSIRADLGQIEQIILNLFINARDAMPKGGVLRVRTYNVSESAEGENDHAGTDAETICLEISDTGCGIREDVRKHLFEPFFTTKKVGEGTGLGLSVVYGIVQQHGGRIDVTSEVGEGSVFKVYLPACDYMESLDVVDAFAEELDFPMEGHGEKILVVEDDMVVRNLNHRMLCDAGYSVIAIENIEKAIAALDKIQFDLLLVDVVLPDGSGVDLVRRAYERFGDLTVLFCSGHSHGSDVHDAMNVRGARYLEKPIGSMQLLQSVREMLDENRSV